MEISKRLQAIASYVPKNAKVVDVGTDHGYIPIYLIKNKMAKTCIACDINPRPLNNAQRNIRRYNMEDQIETRLASGLSKIKVGEADVIIIAGMGGMLIIDILKEKLDLVKAVGLLILQAQLDFPLVRKFLHQINFFILEEEMVYEDGKYYTVIVAKPGQEKPYSKIEYILGKKTIKENDIVFKDFVSYKINELSKLKENLYKIDTPHTQNRLVEINQELTMYKEAFNWL